MFEFNPIGYVRNSQKEMYQLPFQTGLLNDMQAVIELEPNQNFEAALSGLEGMERVWVIFVFHKAQNWKPKIMPPRGDEKQGVLATRSPHRPNPIGMSAVRLKEINGLNLIIEDHDLLDGTPVLDIKPYLPYVDSYPEAACGWLEQIERPLIHQLQWNGLAEEKRLWLVANDGPDLKELASVNLQLKPFPAKGNRIQEKGEGYELAVKTWRLSFTVIDGAVMINDIYSGYDDDYLSGEKQSRWDDVPLHRKFLKVFGS